MTIWPVITLLLAIVAVFLAWANIKDQVNTRKYIEESREWFDKAGEQYGELAGKAADDRIAISNLELTIETLQSKLAGVDALRVEKETVDLHDKQIDNLCSSIQDHTGKFTKADEIFLSHAGRLNANSDAIEALSRKHSTEVARHTRAAKVILDDLTVETP